MELRKLYLVLQFIFLSFWIFLFRCVSGYNIETKKIGLLTGTPGSQFGYSVAFANEPGWKERLNRREIINKVYVNLILFYFISSFSFR